MDPVSWPRHRVRYEHWPSQDPQIEEHFHVSGKAIITNLNLNQCYRRNNEHVNRLLALNPSWVFFSLFLGFIFLSPQFVEFGPCLQAVGLFSCQVLFVLMPSLNAFTPVFCRFKAVLGIRDILVRIRILLFSFSSLFVYYRYLLKLHLHHFSKQKKSKNSQNRWYRRIRSRIRTSYERIRIREP